MRFSRCIVLGLFACVSATALRGQSTAPVLSQSLPAQALAPGGDAVTIDLRNYFAVPGLTAVPAGFDSIFPLGGGNSVITLSVTNSAQAVVETLLSGSTLTLTPVAPGSAAIVVRAANQAGAAASSTFAVSVPSGPPAFLTQPRSQIVATGSTVVFTTQATGAASFRWEKNGEPIPGATTSTLVLNSVTAADAGRYTLFATNSFASTATDTASLSVTQAAPVAVGRLTNLSILTSAGAGDRVLTVGAVVGPFDRGGTVPLVIRAVGPTLGQQPFNVGGVLPDPVVTLFAAGATSPLESNDDWGGGETLRSAFEAVAAFPLPPTSRDSALVRTATSVGGYTVQVSGKGSARGNVLAEIYDAAGGNRPENAPRLINVSTLARVDAGSDLAVGFVIAGQTARTVLIRGVGPSLARLGVTDVMADPMLVVFDNTTGQRIVSNDDWAGALELSGAAMQVAAFALAGGTSKDAAVLLTLAPGPYSARISGASGTGGTAIVEVYEVP